ncbi:MAG: acyl-CoA dehydrogenase [Gammaproteobacteria bacterium]|jgi:alkylation response protein AidB-like acyl-CoA dehydrogenase|nr:acyl-CoA dehydrogenase [Gammaproteobacteria bacterium]MBT5201935.1 acyl-CoA dehydrogenase [Gammaproteobacteria bacterium]MBT5602123.1 acyl-CoA dehydrogenase [Gammaproteobacteria bacterium]MBT6246606.1 acyl-CoA dehydrogenase [Gammaproteobacteria bacterium]
MSDLESFRSATRDWLEANCPASMRLPEREEDMIGGGTRQVYRNPDAKVWLDKMAGRGWTAPAWPTEYGGGGLSSAEHGILQDEMMNIGARTPISGMGFSMIGPTLLDYGTEEQKQTHLPKIVSGEIRWCQGYSEPGAGSDLASLQTRCEDRGDFFQVNGQKIWTSGAQYADWIFTLVRTDPKASKHDGISFVLIDMAQEAVSVKPIKLISGNSPFCETFFDNARCEKFNLVGQLNRGWTVGKRLLQHERSSISGLSGGGRRGRYDALGQLPEIAKQYIGEVNGRIDSPALREDVLINQMNQRAFSLTQRRSMEESQSGGTPTFATSLFKYFGSELGKKRLEIQLELMGTQSLGWDRQSFDDLESALTRTWLRSKAGTIAGGSSEIQLNIIAKRVLGLPD